MSLEATQHTPDGAKAFAEFFIKTIDWGYATTSSTYMRHYFDKTCQSCYAFAGAIDKVRNADHRYVGGRFSISATTLSTKPLAKGSQTTALVSFSTTSLAEVDRKGHSVRADPAHDGERFEVSLVWAVDQWRAISLAIEI